MTTSYDGSSGTRHDPLAGLDRPEPPTAQEFTAPGEYRPDVAPTYPGANNGGSDSSALAQLRERMAARDEEPVPMWHREIKGIGLRLVCDPVVDNPRFTHWMKSARPKAKGRRGGQPSDPTDMDQLVMSAYALSETSVAIEIDNNYGTGREPDWQPLRSQEDGQPLTLQSHELWRQYNVMTSLALLQKFYAPKADPRIIDAGQALLDEAGYMGDDPED